MHFHGVRMRDRNPPLDTTFFETVRGLGLRLTPALRDYIESLLGVAPSLDELRETRMEDFFKDLFFDFQDAPSDADLRMRTSLRCTRAFSSEPPIGCMNRPGRAHQSVDCSPVLPMPATA
jgi:hypothetical protein